MSRRCARPSSQGALSSAKPLGADGRHSGSPRRLCACMTGPMSGGVTPTARSDAMIHSPGRLSLARGASQASGAVTSAFASSFRSPWVARKRLASRSTKAGGGSSAMKWRASLVATCLAVAGCRASVSQHRAALLHAGVGIAPADHGLRARLVHVRIEHEFAGTRSRPVRGAITVQPVITLAKRVTSSCV